jgi:hypothetical protein
MQKIVADKKEEAGAAGESTAPPALSLKKPSELKGRDPYAPIASPRRGLEGRETSRREKAGPGMPEQPGGRNVQDLDSQPAAVETKHPATERIEDREADILS